MNKNTELNLRNRAKMIKAAIILWEAKGEKGVTGQAVGDLCGVTRQRVTQVFKSMEALRTAAALQAVKTGRQALIDRLRLTGHPMAPK